jgi:hypothetical protein
MRDRRGWVVPVVVAMFALAIGLVLGSGPLRTALIGSLGAQVDSLEGQVDEAELAAERANVENDYGQEWVDATAPMLLGEELSGRAVATIALDGADANATEGVARRIVDAGGSVAAAVTVAPLWTDPNQSAFRAALASQLAPSVIGLDGHEEVDEVFAQALAQSLMPTLVPQDGDGDDGEGDDGEAADSEEELGAAADRAGVLWTLLSDAGLVTGEREAAADSIVLIAGEPAEDDAVAESQVASQATIATVLTQYDAALVAANGPDAEGDLVSTIIADTDVLAPRISTVTWINTPYSQATVALALREQLDGWVGHYGPGEGREPAPPLNQ